MCAVTPRRRSFQELDKAINDQNVADLSIIFLLEKEKSRGWKVQ